MIALLTLPVISKFLANFCFAFGLGRIFLNIYRTNAYLYQANSFEIIFRNWIEYLYPISQKIKVIKYKNYLKPILKRANWRLGWNEDHFIAMQLFSILVMFFFGVLFFVFFDLSVFIIILLIVLSFVFPLVLVRNKANVRIKSIIKDMPYLIDYLALVISAGMSFNGALEKVLENIKKSPIQEEFNIVFKSMKLGKTQSEALKDFSDRMNHVNISQFVETMIQAIKQGSEVSVALQTISSSNSAKRFQRAEEEAGKIAVKMIVPVILFVLPTIMVMLIAPIALDLFK